jgi:hypothetical protein
MSDRRFKVLIALGVVILVVASLLFGLLTYWLGQEVLPAASSLSNPVGAWLVLVG